MSFVQRIKELSFNFQINIIIVLCFLASGVTYLIGKHFDILYPLRIVIMVFFFYGSVLFIVNILDYFSVENIKEKEGNDG